MQDQKNINTTERVKARGYFEGLLKYETMHPAQVFLRIFQVTSPVSKYLQTSGMDILSAHRMVVSTEEQLKETARHFEKVKAAADTVVQWANRKLQEWVGKTELELETTLPMKRARKRRKPCSERWHNEIFTGARRAYRSGVHNQRLDTVLDGIHQLFLSNGTLYPDMALLDSKL
jgi:hypothetical protein